MRWAMVVPVVDTTMGVEFIESIDPDLRQYVCVVSNGAHADFLPVTGRKVVWGMNLGVSRAWNEGIKFMRDMEADLLWIASSSVRFGEMQARDLAEKSALASGTGLEVPAMGWHLAALRRDVFEVVGDFDENFYPAYYEDTDYLYRMGLAGFASPRENGRSRPYVDIDASLVGTAMSLKKVQVDFDRVGRYYERKWGGIQGEEKFKTPFDTGRSWKWCP